MFFTFSIIVRTLNKKTENLQNLFSKLFVKFIYFFNKTFQTQPWILIHRNQPGASLDNSMSFSRQGILKPMELLKRLMKKEPDEDYRPHRLTSCNLQY